MIKPEILAYFGSTSGIATDFPVVDLHQTGEKDCKGARDRSAAVAGGLGFSCAAPL